MPDRSRSASRPCPTRKLAADIATGEVSDQQPDVDSPKSAAALLAQIGGLKGGRTRSEGLSQAAGSEIARKAAAAPLET